MTPTARTLAECKRRGYVAQVVEQNIRISGRRIFKRDLFGVIDIVAVTPPENHAGYEYPCSGAIVGIQVTSGSNHAARIAKAKAEPRLQRWLSAGARFEVWSWSKRGARGKRKTWTLRIEEVTP